MASKNGKDAKRLTAKEEQFCQRYLVHLNITKAAQEAGYSKNRPDQRGWEVLQKEKVQKRIQNLMDERGERTKIDQDYVIGSLKEVADKCMGSENWNPKAANKSLELLGKHLKLFTEQHEHNVTLTLGQLSKQLEDKDE